MGTRQLRRVVSKIAEVVADMNEAQRRMMVLRAAPDRYVLNAGQPPASYDEFLARTSGLLLHEPPASRRGPGPLPR